MDWAYAFVGSNSVHGIPRVYDMLEVGCAMHEEVILRLKIALNI